MVLLLVQTWLCEFRRSGITKIAKASPMRILRFLVVQLGKGTFIVRGAEGSMLIIKVDVSIHSPQYCVGILDWKSNALAVSKRYLYFLSTIPFCYDVYGHDFW